MKKYLFGFGTVIAIIGIAFAIQFSPSVKAAEENDGPHELSGWAWSSNIGWISFNYADTNAGGGPYWVQINNKDGGDTTFDFEGHAWSPHIGWISFNANDITKAPACPGSPATVDMSTGKVTGFIRAIAGIGRVDGWDGCINLSDISKHPSGIGFNGSKGVTYHAPEYEGGGDSNGYFKGYAWGGPVVGWLHFSPNISTSPTKCETCGEAPQFSCFLTLDPNGSTLVWGSSGYTQCTIDGDLAGTDGSNTFPPGTYELSCSGGNAPAVISTCVRTVTINQPPEEDEDGLNLLIGKTPEVIEEATNRNYLLNVLGLKSLKVKRGEKYALAWGIDINESFAVFRVIAKKIGEQSYIELTGIPVAASGISSLLSTTELDIGTYELTLQYKFGSITENYQDGPKVTLQIVSSSIQEI